jgi:ubiquinone biosynthesis monooxygenase Coq7
MDNAQRAINPFDQLIVGFDKALRVVGGVAKAARPNPGLLASDCELNHQEARHSAGLMRVNHVGEVCAQALYDAQGKHASTPALRAQMAHSGREEEDHLAWTAERLAELGSQPSLLNPLWYAGAYAMGSVAARLGDAVSLGFVVETERQVEAHLNSHLDELPPQDAKSRAIVTRMRDDEIAHGAQAQAMGAAAMPFPVKMAMRAMAKVMTKTAYYI